MRRLLAYGANRADWFFLWYEGEYVIPVAASFIYSANAAGFLPQ